MDKYGIIYLIRNNTNGKLYVGQTTEPKGFDGRYDGDVEKYTTNQHLKNAFKKYGMESFTVLKEFDVAYSKEELDALEDMYICLYNTIDSRYGYNKKRGGGVNTLTQESKYKISVSRKGKCRGEEHPKSRSVICLNTKQVFSSAREASTWCGEKGNNIYMVCMGDGVTAGRHPETKEYLQWAFLEDYNRGLKTEVVGYKQIICLTTGEVFVDLVSAMKWCGSTHIHSCCKGKRKSAGKHPLTGEKLQWQYYKDYLEQS